MWNNICSYDLVASRKVLIDSLKREGYILLELFKFGVRFIVIQCH